VRYRTLLRAVPPLIMAAIGCTGQPPASVQTRPATSGTQALADTIARLTHLVGLNRARLDSAVFEIHRISHDPSASAIARSRQLRRGAALLDSTYRANLAELLRTVNASTSASVANAARFPVDAPPAPLLRAFADGSNWMLQSPLIVEIARNSPHVIIVPRGFVTDFASIPRQLRVLLPTTTRYGNAALVHDYLYWRQDCTRAQADNIMAIAMIEAGVPLVERRLVHEAVRVFGQGAWDTNQRDRRAGLIRTIGPPQDQVPLSGSWAEYRQWLRTTRAKEGLEYSVPQSVCAVADTVKTRDWSNRD